MTKYHELTERLMPKKTNRSLWEKEDQIIRTYLKEKVAIHNCTPHCNTQINEILDLNEPKSLEEKFREATIPSGSPISCSDPAIIYTLFNRRAQALAQIAEEHFKELED